MACPTRFTTTEKRLRTDGKMYVQVGSNWQLCKPNRPWPDRRYNAGAPAWRSVARGVRKHVGSTPSGDQELWFTDNGRDWRQRRRKRVEPDPMKGGELRASVARVGIRIGGSGRTRGRRDPPAALTGPPPRVQSKF